MGKVIKIFVRIFLFSLVSFFLLTSFVFLALWTTDVEVPQSMVDNVCARFSTADYALRIDAATFNLKYGLRLYSVRVLERNKAAMAMVSASRVEVDFHLGEVLRFGGKPDRLVKKVIIADLKYPRLPDSYYIPNHVLHPGEPDYMERNSPIEMELPKIRKIKLELVNPDILGINPKRVFATLRGTSKNFLVEDFVLEWPDRDVVMTISGFAGIDIPSQKVFGEVKGQARQYHIRPLLQTLDIPISLEYIDAFTNVTAPVNASCAFTVNLMNSDLLLNLHLSPKSGKYRGSPFLLADGDLQVYSYVRGTNSNQRVTIGPVKAELPDGGFAKGTVVCDYSNSVARIHLDVQAEKLSIPNALNMSEMLNDGTLDCLETETLPDISVAGMIVADSSILEENNLFGTVSFGKGSLFGIPMRDAAATFHLHGTTMDFDNVSFSNKSGGKITGEACLEMPNFEMEKSKWMVTIKAADLQLSDLADALKIDAGDKYGRIDGEVRLSGPFKQDLVKDVIGEGSLRLHDGHLSRVNLYLGLTNFLADKIPGVAKMLDQSSASLDFSICDGTITTKNLRVDGNFLSAAIDGGYDIVNDNLDLNAGIRFFKKDSLISTITSPITFPLMKSLLEFKVQGPIDNPKWRYRSAIEQGIDAITDKGKPQNK